MSDASGHRERPGNDASNSAQITISAIPTNYYWFENPATYNCEHVKIMPP